MALRKEVKILSNAHLKERYFKLSFQDRELARKATPGQFIHVRVASDGEPLLRRPFSIHRVSNGKVEILYTIVGKGTEKFSQKKSGESLDIIGPLGNGFTFGTKHQTPNTKPILIAGGMGVAPLLFLAEKLVRNHPLVLIGAKTKNHILCENEFKKLGCEIRIATDDGSRGFKGYVSELFKKVLLTVDCRLSTIYACGPRLMLKEIRKLCSTKNIPCQASFEENIACGLGACLGCAVKTKTGFKRVCFDGPVFDIKEVII